MRHARARAAAGALVAAAVLLCGCRSLGGISELPLPRLGDFGPSEAGVRQALGADRVREAREDAEALARRYAGPRIELLTGWTRLRTGDVAAADRGFRRAAAAGLTEGTAGLGYVAAARGEWDRAEALGKEAVGDRQAVVAAHQIRAATAWWRGDAPAAAAELRGWLSHEAAEPYRRDISSLSVAIDALRGPAWRMEGTPSRVELGVAGPALVVPARLAGSEVRLRLDGSRGQSEISPEAAEAAGLTVVSTGPDPADDPGERPAFVGEGQVACDLLEVGGLRVRDVVLAVRAAPEGADGVLGADFLARARWALRPAERLLAVGPPQAGAAVDALVGDEEDEVVAWLGAHLHPAAIRLQIFLMPRLDGRPVPASLDLAGPSKLDPHDLVADATAEIVMPLRLGAWRGDVTWQAADLSPRAAGGGAAPRLTLGLDLLEPWIVSWDPATRQIRLTAPSGPPPALD